MMGSTLHSHLVSAAASDRSSRAHPDEYQPDAGPIGPEPTTPLDLGATPPGGLKHMEALGEEGMGTSWASGRMRVSLIECKDEPPTYDVSEILGAASTLPEIQQDAIAVSVTGMEGAARSLRLRPGDEIEVTVRVLERDGR